MQKTAAKVSVTTTKVSLTGLSSAHDAVMVHSAPVDEGMATVAGCMYEGDKAITAFDLISSFETSGFQATHLGRAARIIKNMLSWRLVQEDLTDEEQNELHADGWKPPFSWAVPEVRKKTRATIFLSFTSNMISSGLREAFVYLAKHKLVDCIVTSAGGIEEDLIKCLGEFVVGSFHGMKGRELRAKGWNRIGNIYVPNENYIKFEAWLQPIITACVREQDEQGTVWTPATFIERLGREINDESSLLFWCTRNHIPVFCPALTDGSIGDNLYFHHATHPSHLHFDIVADIAAVNNLARDAKRTGLLVLGGGAPKHHVCNANLMRNGADFAVYLNTAQEFDGCDSGAAVDEAVSWGKIKADAQSIKVNFPAVGHPHAVGHDHPRSVRAHHPSPPPRVKVPTR